MPKRFTRAIYAASAVAVAASSLALSASAADAASHAPRGTAACGFSCVNFFSQQLGSNTSLNAFVPGDTGIGGKVGQKVNLHLGGNFRPNGDFEYGFTPPAFVFQFCGFLANDFFAPTSFICTHYPFAPVLELVWSPFGNQTNLCAGVAKPGLAGESVTLQLCGANADTVWVGDIFHGTGGSCLTPVPGFALPVPPSTRRSWGALPGPTSSSRPSSARSRLGAVLQAAPSRREGAAACPGW